MTDAVSNIKWDTLSFEKKNKNKISSSGRCNIHFPKLFNYSKITFKKQNVKYAVYICFQFGGIWASGTAAFPVISTYFSICTSIY